MHCVCMQACLDNRFQLSMSPQDVRAKKKIEIKRQKIKTSSAKTICKLLKKKERQREELCRRDMFHNRLLVSSQR